VEKQEAKQSLG